MNNGDEIQDISQCTGLSVVVAVAVSTDPALTENRRFSKKLDAKDYDWHRTTMTSIPYLELG